MDYATRLNQWQQNLTSLEQNIAIAQQLKAKGIAILNSLEIDKGKIKDIDLKTLAELIKNSTQAITQGAKLEQDSRKERAKLMNSKPIEI